jgi:hypothetical protein
MQQVTTVPSVGQGFVKFTSIYVTEISQHQLDYKDGKWICLKEQYSNIVPKTSGFQMK